MSAEGLPEAKRPLIVGLIVGSYALYIAFSRIIPRDSFGWLLAGFAGLFLLYFFLVRNRDYFSLRQILLVALLLRVAFVVSVPALSDDFYRFSWDGRMWWEGMHPLEGTPNELIAEGKGDVIDPTGELRSGLNSPDYDTVYPPVSQFFYALAAGVSGKSLATEIVLLHVLLIAMEMLAIWCMARLLPAIGRKMEDVIIYAFNPLVIVEVSGNLHFEGVMLAFMVLAIWAWWKKKPAWGIFAFCLSVATKLIPIMLLALLPRWLGWKRSILSGIGVAALLVAMFLPFLWGQLEGFGTSVDLFVSQFEFNASGWYLAREVGRWMTGYNEIGILGPWLKLLTVGVILWLAFRKRHDVRSVLRAAVWAWAAYLFLATTVHPWYVIPIVGLATLTGQVWPVVWSGLIVLSYSHYQGGGFEENYLLIGAEYLLLLAAILWEVRSDRLRGLAGSA